MTCNKSPPPMKSAVTSSLLLLLLTAPQLVTSFIPSNNHQFNTVKLHQKRIDHEQNSLILNCNNINDNDDILQSIIISKHFKVFFNKSMADLVSFGFALRIGVIVLLVVNGIKSNIFDILNTLAFQCSNHWCCVV